MGSKIIIGVVSSAGIALFSFMGYGIVNNDVRNSNDHIEIRREYLVGDVAVTRKIEKVQDTVTDIRLKQTEQRVLLQFIADKL